MDNHIRKIDHNGEEYGSIRDILKLLKKGKSIDEIKSILSPEKTDEFDLGDALFKAVNYNPYEYEHEVQKSGCEESLNKYKSLIGKEISHKSDTSQKIKILKLECEESETENGFHIKAYYINNKSHIRNTLIDELHVLQKAFKIPVL